MSQFSQVEITNVPAIKESAENMHREGQGSALADSIMPNKENQQAYRAMELQKCGPSAKIMPDLEITNLPKKFSVDEGITAIPKDKEPRDGGPKDGGLKDEGLTEGNGKKGGSGDGGPKDPNAKDSEIKHGNGGDEADNFARKSKLDLQNPGKTAENFSPLGKQQPLEAKPESK